MSVSPSEIKKLAKLFLIPPKDFAQILSDVIPNEEQQSEFCESCELILESYSKTLKKKWKYYIIAAAIGAVVIISLLIAHKLLL